MGEYNEVDNVQNPTKDFDEIIKEVENNLNCIGKDKPCHMHYEELQQFHRGHFYRQWWHRFRRLGSVGVIAIPNTTLEDMIYWLYEFMRAYQEDYNEFKKLVCQALNLHEEHLNIVDGVLKDHEDRIKEIEKQLVEIWNKINEILGRLDNIDQEISHIKNDITNINNNINNVNTEINKLWGAINAIKQNVFNVAYGKKINGTLQNGWHMKQDKDREFAIVWDWNNSDDHSQGAHWIINMNYIYKSNATASDIANSSLIGTVDIPSEVLQQFPHIGDTWVYSGYALQSWKIVGVPFFKFERHENQYQVKIVNTPRTGILEGDIGEVQINAGGTSANYWL